MNINFVYDMIKTILNKPTITFIVEVIDLGIKPRKKNSGDYSYIQGLYPLYIGVREISFGNEVYSNQLDFYDAIIPTFSNNKFSVNYNRCGKMYIINSLLRIIKRTEWLSEDLIILVHSVRNNRLIKTDEFLFMDMIDNVIRVEDDFGDIEIIKK